MERPARDDWRREVEDVLTDLCGIESANERPEDPRPVEAGVASYIKSYLAGIGVSWEASEWLPGRECVIGVVPGKGGASLALEAHMDTVPVVGCEELLSPRREPDRLVARGACDAKGSLAAMMVALRLFLSDGVKPRGDVFLVAVPGEETGCEGARYLMKKGFRPDGIVVGEPTALDVVVRHKGVVWGTVTTEGKPAHGSRPELGVNAITRMARVVNHLEHVVIPEVVSARDPMGTSRSVNIGVIRGGTKVNIVPDRCELLVDLRTLPGESADDAARDLGERIRAFAVEENLGAVGWSYTFAQGLDTNPDSPLVQRLLRAVRSVRGREPSLETVSYFADSGVYDAAGIPSVLFGPGDIAQAHTACEFLRWEELHEAVAIIRELLRAGGEPAAAPGT